MEQITAAAAIRFARRTGSLMSEEGVISYMREVAEWLRGKDDTAAALECLSMAADHSSRSGKDSKSLRVAESLYTLSEILTKEVKIPEPAKPVEAKSPEPPSQPVPETAQRVAPRGKKTRRSKGSAK